MSHRIGFLTTAVFSIGLIASIRLIGSQSPTLSLAEVSEQAKLFVANPAQDLGPVAVHGELQVPFLIENRGTKRLVINELIQGCGCCGQTVRSIVIPAGGLTIVFLKLDSRQALGRVEVISIHTCNDPSTPRFELKVSAEVTKSAAIQSR